MVRRNLHQEITLPKNELTRYNEQIGSPSQTALLFEYLLDSFELDMTDFLFDVKNENLTGQNYFRSLNYFLGYQVSPISINI